ncbi:MAG: hypothetical protein ABIJ56_14815 [Pseudomonadota bacterium]
MKRFLLPSICLLVWSCYQSAGLEGDARPDPLEDPFSETGDPMWDPWSDPWSDPYYDPPPDPVWDPWTDPYYDPPPDPAWDPWTDPYTDWTDWTDAMPCPPGLTQCWDMCVDLRTDPNHCGGCGNICPTGSACWDFMCWPGDPCDSIACPEPLECCWGECVDTMWDPYNCGGCGGYCPWGTDDPGLNFEACMYPDEGWGVYNLCCGGECRPVNERNCGECRRRCPDGSRCTGMWDDWGGSCWFDCMGTHIEGMTGDGCETPEDCFGVPSEERYCMVDLGGYVRFPGGYCTAHCWSSDACGPEADCVDVMFDTLCLRRCSGDDECRMDEGYICRSLPMTPETYCVPGTGP